MAIQNTISDFFAVFPPFTKENVLFYFLNFIIFIILFYVIKMLDILTSNQRVARKNVTYMSPIVSDRKILILGDSTAVGTGASSPEETIAGMLAHDFPKTQIVNLAKNGAITSDLVRQVNLVKDQVFHMVIISIGGNDCWSLISQAKIRESLEYCFRETKRMSGHKVIFLQYNNIGSAPVFPAFVSFLVKMRAKTVQSVISECAYTEEIAVIDLFSSTDSNPFKKNPEQLFAKDGIHPSSSGYRMWYTRMWRKMLEVGFVYRG
jgi:lysophospholipase L1-like esterase